MPVPYPDTTRQTPASIDPATDMCRKWSLWGRGDYIDSIICCKLFPELHGLNDAAIARAFAVLHTECYNMTGQDVAELYQFLKSHPDLHTNGFRMWQEIKRRGKKGKGDVAKVAQAVVRVVSNVPKRHNR